MRTWLLTAGGMLLSTALMAGGFQISVQGVKQLGMSNAGAGLALDGSVMFYNPGALVRLPSSGVYAAFTPIMPRITYLEPAPGVYSTSTERTVSPPVSGYAHYKMGERWAFGFGINTPFGSRVVWPDDWKGQFAIREIALKTFFLQPTVSFAINDHISIGAGPVMAMGSVVLRKGVPAQDTSGAYGEAILEGKGEGYGFNVGAHIRAGERLQLALSYRSGVKFQADAGQATFTVPSALAEYFPATPFSATLNLPWNVAAGAAWAAIPEKLHMALDVQYVGWSVYKELRIDFEQNTDKLEDLVQGKNYQNSFVFRLGGNYRLNDHISLRAGTYLDMTPVPDGYTSPETPDANKVGATAGASYRTGRLELDACLAWVEGLKRTDINVESNFGGTYKSRAFVPGIALGYTFGPRPETGGPY